MVKSLNHIGIAVSDLEKSIELFKKIFQVDKFHIESVESQGVKIASFKIGNVLIELTAPLGSESPIAKYIEKRGEGIHHLAFEVDNIEKELQRLKQEGISLVNEIPTEGGHQMKIAFLHPKSTNGVLIELCQKVL
jgi:methylmalonyl-CoA/ethylmalonyl-CoA epimerase